MIIGDANQDIHIIGYHQIRRLAHEIRRSTEYFTNLDNAEALEDNKHVLS